MKFFSKLQLLGLVLVILTVNSCLLPEQVDGLCTSCEQDQLLSFGSCYVKIHKCQFQEKQVCFECKTDYMLVQNQCYKIKKSLQTHKYEADEPIDNSRMMRRGLQIISVGGPLLLDPSEYTSTQFLSVVSTIQLYYPSFSTAIMTKALYQIVSGTNYFIYFKFPNTYDIYEVAVYVYLPFYKKPNQIRYVKKNGYQIPIPAPYSPLLNSITVLSSSQYNVEPFLSVQRYIKLRYSTFTSTLISKVEYQVVSGTIYTVYFKLPNLYNTYQVKVMVPTMTASSISTYYYLSIKVNGISIAI